MSFFESANRAHFNSVAMIDADGSLLGVYRKSHIPDGPGYEVGKASFALTRQGEILLQSRRYRV